MLPTMSVIPPRLLARRALVGLTIGLLLAPATPLWAEESPVAEAITPDHQPFR